MKTKNAQWLIHLVNLVGVIILIAGCTLATFEILSDQSDKLFIIGDMTIVAFGLILLDLADIATLQNAIIDMKG